MTNTRKPKTDPNPNIILTYNNMLFTAQGLIFYEYTASI